MCHDDFRCAAVLPGRHASVTSRVRQPAAMRPGGRFPPRGQRRNEFSQVRTHESARNDCVTLIGRPAARYASSSVQTVAKVTPAWSRRKNHYPQLLSLAVHELRTPASVVGGYLRMLQRDTDAERAPAEDDREAEKSCARWSRSSPSSARSASSTAASSSSRSGRSTLFALIAEVAELVHEARDRDVHLKYAGERRRDDLRATPRGSGRHSTRFFARFLREKAGPCTVVAERRIETRIGERASPS